MKAAIISDQIHMDLEKALPIIQEHGYRYVEIHNVFGKSIEQCTDEEVIRIKKMLDRYGMKVSNICSTVFFLCPLYEDYQVSLFNPDFYSIKGNVNVHLSYLERACKIAKTLECKTIRVFPFRFPDNKEGLFGIESHREQIAKNIKQAAQIAKQYDRILVVENCPYSHCPKAEMTLDIIKRVNENNVRLLWDPANSYRAIKKNVPEEFLKIDLLEELELIYPYIEYIHIKDYHYDEQAGIKPFVHKPIYDGDIDFDSIFSTLKEKGYSGYVSLEPEVPFDEAILCMKRLKEKGIE